MGYKPDTVAATVAHLNQNYFLPAIQRQFVWGPERIIRLFDSLLRGYPISSFLFWELRPENRDRWQVYRFIDEARADGSHNHPANTDGIQQLTLVLDGQQRLTSLLLGLKGTYIVKKKYKRAKAASAWSPQRLFLDLLKDPKTALDDDDQGVRYGFAFAEDQPPNNKDHHWIKVGRILDFDSDDQFDRFKDQEEDRLPLDATRDKGKLLRSNLERLHRAIWKEQLIAYHTEVDQDYDRVLDIFVRANDGGVKLSKSDLLLSMVTAKWGDLNAREEIYGFVDRLNVGLNRKNSFDKDFLMKTCLVVSDLNVKYKVENFNNQNLELIKTKWTDIQLSTRKAVELINSFGIDGEMLTSSNAIIPIIYYLYRNPKFTLGGTTSFDAKNAAAIRLWLTAALLQNVFSGHSDTALTVTRGILQGLAPDTLFPIEQLSAEMAKAGRPSTFDAEAVEEIIKLEYGDDRTFLALNLLQGHRSWMVDPDVDHIFPKSGFSKGMEKVSRFIDRLGNLQLLAAKENQEKSAKDFETWIQTRDENFLDRQLIPKNQELWKIDKFELFLEARERLIREKLKAMFTKKTESANFDIPY